MRVSLGLVLAVVLMSNVSAQEAESPWRETVSGQIEALRTGDAAAALEFAGAAFKSGYTDPEQFLLDVQRSGYRAIIESRTHSFGAFRELSAGGVAQIVTFIGPDQGLDEAVYTLTEEPGEGWRVQGVIIRPAAGLAT